MKDLETRKKELSKIINEQYKIQENTKYGEFVIQSNEVQLYLILLIDLWSFLPDESLKKYLERLELGSLIGHFRICVKNSTELVLIDYLKKYKNERNKLAHKMFTNKKLTIEECELAVNLGNKIINILERLILISIKQSKKYGNNFL